MENNDKNLICVTQVDGKTNAANIKSQPSNNKQTTTKIKLALLDLLRDVPLSQVSITNLVKLAGVYRATFYLHYKSINDVIVDIEKDVYDCYTTTIKEQIKDVDLFNNMEALIEKIGQNIQIDKKYLKVIINTNCFNRLTLKLKELLYETVVYSFTKFGHMKSDDEFRLAISTFTGGVVFAYRDWINNLDMELDVLETYIKKLSKAIFNN